MQQLCGWNSNTLLDSQESPSRKAAIALFHLKMKLAIKILNEANHSTVAMVILANGMMDMDRGACAQELLTT